MAQGTVQGGWASIGSDSFCVDVEDECAELVPPFPTYIKDAYANLVREKCMIA